MAHRPSPRIRRIALAIAALVVAVSCGAPGPVTPPPAGTGTVTPAPTDAPSPSPPPVPSLRVVLDGDQQGGLSNAAVGEGAARAAGFMYDGLYRLDERLRPVPALAREPATVSPDGRTWTLTLRDDVRFHDGSPLTADDVVQTYAIARSQRCRFGRSTCLSAVLEDVTKVDERTVAFTLVRPLAAFATTYLGIWIDSKAAVDRSFATFLDGIEGVTASETATFLRAVAAEEADPTGPDDASGRPTVDYAQFREPGEALLARVGLAAPQPADPAGAGGSPDLDAYVLEIAGRVRAIDASFTSTSIDALAAAYPYLDLWDAPVGTGPFRFVSEAAGGELELAANDAYFAGVPQVERLTLLVAADDQDPAQALADGRIDWWAEMPVASYERIRSDSDVRFVEYPEFGFLGLSFNLHPEADGLFADRRLRQALASCFDNEATVAAATGGHGLAIDSEIPRMSWAYPGSGFAAYPVDRERASELIESVGWSLGEDGIYEQGDRRLSTVVPLREGFPERTAWLRSVAEQVRSCGIELRPEEVTFDAILDMLAVYPHVNAATPDDGRPFDAYFGGLDVYLDPDPYRLYHSSECSSAERPNTYNFVCYQDSEVDRLIEAGQVETDLERRATIYGEYAGRIAEDLPVIYAWSDLVREGIASTIGTTDPDGLALDTPTWYAPLERLTNVR